MFLQHGIVGETAEEAAMMAEIRLLADVRIYHIVID